MTRNLIIALILFLGLQSCGERVLIRRYYVLEFPASADTTIRVYNRFPAVCEILPVRIPPAYSQHRIAVRERSHEISYYQYNQWAMEPMENLTSLVELRTRNAEIFSQVSGGEVNRVPDYQVDSRVYHLEAIDTGDNYFAHLEMRMALIDYGSRQVEVVHQFNRREVLESRDVNLFARMISEILLQETDRFLSQVHSFLNQQSPRSPSDINP